MSFHRGIVAEANLVAGCNTPIATKADYVSYLARETLVHGQIIIGSPSKANRPPSVAGRRVRRGPSEIMNTSSPQVAKCYRLNIGDQRSSGDL